MAAQPTSSSAHHYKFDITMSCSGCSGAVDRVLKKMDGIENYEISLENQCADVWTGESVGFEAVLEKIKKTGKTVTGAWRDGVVVEVKPEGK